MIKTFTKTDTNQYSIKPQDLGFDTETAVEMAPVTRTAVTGKTPAAKEMSGTSRPNLMIYPGE